MAVSVKKVALEKATTLKGLRVPAIVSFKYRNGVHSVNPGAISKRTVLVEETTPNTISGLDFSRGGEYRKFSRRLITDARIHGLLIPADAIDE